MCATLLSTAIDFTSLDPIKALVWSAVANGVIAVPIMAVMMLIGANRRVLGDAVLSRRHRSVGWLVTAVMLGAVGAVVRQWLGA